MSYNDLYSLRNEKLSVKLRDTQMTAATIAKIFNVFPQSIVLVGADGTVATPDSNGDFSFLELSCETSWTVNGDPSKVDDSHKLQRPSSSYAYQQPQNTEASKTKWKPGAFSANRHKPPGVTKQEGTGSGRRPSSSWTKTVEVCTYDVHDSSFKKTFNLPLTLTDDTSTVNKVADLASAEAFGGDSVVILDSDNLRIPDSAGTRGSKFWRSTRKVKAIRNEDYLEFHGKRKRSPIFDFSDSDSDFEMPTVKKSLLSSSNKPKTKECIDLTTQGETSVSKTTDAVQDAIEMNKLKDVTTRIEKIEANLSKSLEKHEELERVRRIVSCLEEDKQALQRSIEDLKIHLSCIICKNVAKFPWLVTQCCTVLMCKDCGEQWLRMESSCPHCRAVVDFNDCITVTRIRAIQEIISSFNPEN